MATSKAYTDTEVRTRLNNLRTLHDKIKEHPFWVNFDTRFASDIGIMFHELACNVFGTADETNPYYSILRASTHEMCCMSRNFGEYVKNGMFERNKNILIIVLQAYLQNVHMFIDGNDPVDTVSGFLVDWDVRPAQLTKLVAEWDEDEKKYRVLVVISDKEHLERVKQNLERWSTALNDESATCKWARESLTDIEKGNVIIGKFWKYQL